MKKLNKQNIEGILALTTMQEGMLYHYLKEPESPLYFEQLSLEITGDIQRTLFEETWNTVIQTNEMLRTVFRWQKMENPVQIALKEHKIQPLYNDLTDIDHTGNKTQNREQYIKEQHQQIKTKDRQKKFNLQEVPFRVTLCKLAENKYQMIISNHHIIYDGWSNGIILKEFFETYKTLAAGKEVDPPSKTKFNQYVKWLQKQDINRQEQYWKEYLQEIEATTGLSVKKRNQREKIRPATITLNWGSQIKNTMDEYAREKKITPAVIIYSAWGLLLQKYNNCEEVLFGTTVSGRTPKVKGIEEMVGLFINTLPLRVLSRPGEKNREIVQRINRSVKHMEEYENTSLVRIKESSPLGIEDALFDTIVVIENYPLDSKLKSTGGTLFLEAYTMTEMTNYDITVGITLFDEIGVKFMYNQEAFDEESLLRMGGHFKKILQEI
ncbi:MAG: hypothetical protein GY757_42500, partial [bacterium]|nr:hypothetical protein [bacterium]